MQTKLFLLLPALAHAAQTTAEPTQTSTKDEDSCENGLDSFVNGIPEATYFNSITNTDLRPTGTDPCGIVWPTSLYGEVRNYGSTVLDYISSNEKSISTLFSECPSASEWGYVTRCASSWANVGGSVTTSAASTGASSTGAASAGVTSTGGTTTGATTTGATSTSTGGVAKETGVRLAAVAVAGLVAAAL